jgi:hypothetical protein
MCGVDDDCRLCDHAADRSKAPAIVRAQVLSRVLDEEGWKDASGGWTQLEALGKALKAAIRTVRRRDKSVRLVKETIKVPYHGCDELTKALFKGLLPCAFLFNTRCKGTYASLHAPTHAHARVQCSLFSNADTGGATGRSRTSPTWWCTASPPACRSTARFVTLQTLPTPNPRPPRPCQ